MRHQPHRAGGRDSMIMISSSRWAARFGLSFPRACPAPACRMRSRLVWAKPSMMVLGGTHTPAWQRPACGGWFVGRPTRFIDSSGAKKQSVDRIRRRCPQWPWRHQEQHSFSKI